MDKCASASGIRGQNSLNSKTLDKRSWYWIFLHDADTREIIFSAVLRSSLITASCTHSVKHPDPRIPVVYTFYFLSLSLSLNFVISMLTVSIQNIVNLGLGLNAARCGKKRKYRQTKWSNLVSNKSNYEQKISSYNFEQNYRDAHFIIFLRTKMN